MAEPDRRRRALTIALNALSVAFGGAARSQPSRPPARPSRARVARPSVSVVVPAFRAAPTIGRALDSVLAQTRPADQIIVVDDGSPDDIAGAIAGYGERVQLIRKGNGGVSSARNVGIDRATGNLLAFLDADDAWEPQKLERQLAVLAEHPELGMVGATLYLETPGTAGRRVDPAIDSRLFDRVLELDGSDAFHAAGMFWTGTIMIRRDELGADRFDEGLSTAEDRDLWLRLLLRAPAWLSGEPLATCVLVPGSLSRGSIDRDCTNMLAVINRYRTLLGPAAHARWTADLHRRWSTRLLAEGAPHHAIAPAFQHLRRAPSAPALWTLVKSTALATTTPRRPVPAVTSTLSIEQIVDDRGLRALEHEWRDLHERSSAYRPSTSWDWLQTWWEVFGASRELRVLVARDRGRLVGIAPLLARTVRVLGVPLRRLELLASGEPEADEIFSEYLDFIIETGREREVIERFWQHLAANPDWDDLLLVSIPAESRLRAALRDATASDLVDIEEQPRSDAVVVPLATTPTEHLAAQSKRMREDLRRQRRLLEQYPAVKLRRAETLDEMRELFPVLGQLHTMLWQSRGKPGCFASSRFRHFHDAVTERMFALGRLNLYVLEVGERPVAARYAFHLGRRMFEYQSGFDPEFDPRLSIGMVAAHLCMEDALARGYQEYDLGEGPRAYKLRWRHVLRHTYDLRVARRNVRNELHRLMRNGTERLKQVRDTIVATDATAGGPEEPAA